MSDACCNIPDQEPRGSYKKILWVALILNLTMFFVEIGAGVKSDSLSLLADAIDFFGDAGNYAISIFVLGLGMRMRAKASLFKAACMLLFGVYVITFTATALFSNEIPQAHVMGIIGFIALAVNLAVAVMLYKFRDGDSNMQSVWLCSRNDAIGNIAVMLGALGVYVTTSNIPDLTVALIMGVLGISASYRVIRSAKDELK